MSVRNELLLSEVRENAKNGRRHTKKKEKGPRSIIVTRNIILT